VPQVAATTPSSLVVIGEGLLLLGIVIALGGGIRFYAENRYSRKLARWGGLLSAPGAAAVLVGTVKEVSPSRNPLKPVELAVLGIAVLVVLALLVIPRLPRSFLNFVEEHVEKDPEDESRHCDRAAAQCRREGEDDEVRPEQDSHDARQMAQAQAKAGQPR
jgi:4-amino-4-deoxy-L-arabinose transferase-like glycosyltransferase